MIALDGEIADESECRNCGAHVALVVQRVIGDSDNVAHRCRDCDSDRRLGRGSGAGVEVAIPDPETSPGHRGNETLAVADGGVDRGQLTIIGWAALIGVLCGLMAVTFAVVMVA